MPVLPTLPAAYTLPEESTAMESKDEVDPPGETVRAHWAVPMESYLAKTAYPEPAVPMNAPFFVVPVTVTPLPKSNVPSPIEPAAYTLPDRSTATEPNQDASEPLVMVRAHWAMPEESYFTMAILPIAC